MSCVNKRDLGPGRPSRSALGANKDQIGRLELLKCVGVESGSVEGTYAGYYYISGRYLSVGRKMVPSLSLAHWCSGVEAIKIGSYAPSPPVNIYQSSFIGDGAPVIQKLRSRRSFV